MEFTIPAAVRKRNLTEPLRSMAVYSILGIHTCTVRTVIVVKDFAMDAPARSVISLLHVFIRMFSKSFVKFC